jgi:L-glutamine-phosphate cytidylyltransferase
MRRAAREFEEVAVAVTKAIILAAGVGSRLRPLTDALPKCLLDVGGQTLLRRQIDALGRAGVTDVVAVLGYERDLVRRHAGGAVRYLDNDQYQSTNSLYSLWLAREELATGAVIVNSDVLALPLLFDRLVRAPAPDAVLVELGHAFEPEDMKVSIRDGLVVDFGKDLTPPRAQAHNVGVAKFSPDGAARLVECLDRLVASGHHNDWAPVAFREFASHWPLVAVPTAGLPWIEIDYVGDLTRARVEVEPAIRALEHALAL